MRCLTIGTFDLYHVGHELLLDRAAWFGPLTVGVNSDRFTTQYKGAPVEPENYRCLRVAKHPGVTEVTLNDGPGIDLIRAVKPDMLVIGSDWLGRDYPAQLGTTADELTALRVSVLFLPRTPGVSTTELRNAA